MNASVRRLVIASGLSLALGAGTATAANGLSSQTRTNRDAAMHGEAFAAAKYMLYADKARGSGHKALAAYFEEAAKTERTDHFAKEERLFGLVGSNEANLRDAINGEHCETTMYPKFAAQAEAAGDAQAASLFREIAKDEAQHRRCASARGARSDVRRSVADR